MFKSGGGGRRGGSSLGLNTRQGRGKSQSNLLSMGGRSRSKSQSRLYQSQANLGLTRSNLALQESRSRSNLYEESPVKSSGTLIEKSESTQRGRATNRPRLFSGSSARSASKPRPPPRSKSRENIRQQRPKPRQSSSLPRQGGQKNQRAPMRRSRSTWSLKSANYKKRPNAGECSIL